MTSTPFAAVTANVKIVIWDLDETFWHGTLSEEGITPIPAHVDMVRTLTDRGILCSICSKNDMAPARAKLEELGIWDLFVFPHVDWTPKGQAINTMLERMGLRAENALFLDDNHLNLEEAQFFNEGLMVLDAAQGLDGLLDLPQLQGKDDRAHSRLKQYKDLEGKFTEQAASGLSNEEFLRQSQIRIKIITDLDGHWDRVLEILNRTNQLNFTKVRANTDEELAELKRTLAVSGMHAGLIHVKDRYGDYGIVGFFCVRTKFSGTTVHHFAFSCRTLNMGVEQWVWAYLNKPEFKVVGPVAGQLDAAKHVDWITEVTDFDSDTNALEEKRLCLVGGCDLLQVSFYCGTNRDEFVNKQDGQGMLVRYDDVGFFLNPRDQELKHSRTLNTFAGWTLDDMMALDASLGQADLTLLSMFFSVPTDNLFSFGGNVFGGKYWATIPPRRIKKLMKDPDSALRFAKEMYFRRLNLGQRLELTRRSFERAHGMKRADAPLFILGAATVHGEQAKRTFAIRQAFNAMCRAFCDSHPGSYFVDIDQLLDAEEFADSDHYTRTGYFKIAQFVNDTSDALRAGQVPAAPAPRVVAAAALTAPDTPKPDLMVTSDEEADAIITAEGEVADVVADLPGAADAALAPARPAKVVKVAAKLDPVPADKQTPVPAVKSAPAPVAAKHAAAPRPAPRPVPVPATALAPAAVAPVAAAPVAAAPTGPAPGRPEWDDATLQRYMGFLSVEWPRMAERRLVPLDVPAPTKTSVLDATIGILDETPGHRLEFGVWRGNSIRRCAGRFPNQRWHGFDSFEGFPDDGRVDWQKPFKVIELPDTPPNVTLVKGYFSDTLDPFLAHTPGDVAFVNVDCDLYSSTVDIFKALEKHNRLKPGLVIYFDELINYADYMWNESIALFEMLDRTGLGVEWLACDQQVRMPAETAAHFHRGDHPTWNADMGTGYWMQASCRLTDRGMDCGPMQDTAWADKMAWIVDGFRKQEARRAEALAQRNERLVAQAADREQREIERRARDRERAAERAAARKAGQTAAE